ncbi:hypothetical protein [Vulcanisaeta sp. JCM 16159]|uniref:hypothetical protein n=1 Tax=Vulcanisaeta sp. JCM 16159 TaxID=1295371 RepID=UPI000B2B7379|nr:hypothetical protein [Vulcanisaeta sp. JCM 16159]
MSSTYLRMPPRIKVLEALGALADGRVEVINDKEAVVKSSDGTRCIRSMWMFPGGRLIVQIMEQYIGATLVTQ